MIALAPVRTIAPAEALLSVTDAKAHLRVENTDEDALIAALIATAEGQVDGYHGQIGKALLTQTWSQSFNGFPAPNSNENAPPSHLRLAIGPLQEVESVAYIDAAGDIQQFTDFTAATDAIGPKIVLTDGVSWPTTSARPDAVTVTWRCGFGDAVAAVPAPIIHAAKLLIGHFYENRDAGTAGAAKEAPAVVGMLLEPFRAIGAR